MSSYFFGPCRAPSSSRHRRRPYALSLTLVLVTFGAWHLVSPELASAGAADRQHTVALGHFNRLQTPGGIDDIVIGSPRDNGQAGSVTVYWWNPISATRVGVKITEDLLKSSVFEARSAVPNVAADASEAGDLFGYALAIGDFNRDGLSDLAIGAPDEDVSYGGGTSIANAGLVYVLYGSAAPGVAGTPFQKTFKLLPNPFLLASSSISSTEDEFGVALAVGDFNGDQGADLAVGNPGSFGRGSSPKGIVYLYQGMPSGDPTGQLTTSMNTVIENPYGVGPSENFGDVLTAGRFQQTPGDPAPEPGSTDQLVVGIPELLLAGNIARAGGIVLYHFPQTAGVQPPLLGTFYNQAMVSPTFYPETPEANDRFGLALATAPLWGPNRFSALVVGVPFEDVGGKADAGVVHVFSPAGLMYPQLFDSTDWGAALQTRGYLGLSIAAGATRLLLQEPTQLIDIVVGEPGRASSAGAAYRLNSQGYPYEPTPLYPGSGWTSAVPTANEMFGQAVAVGTIGPADSGSPRMGWATKVYATVPGAKQVVQFNKGILFDVSKTFSTP